LEVQLIPFPPIQATVCGFPISIFFIVVNEFCERFSYYGMKAVLVLYFKYFLNWEDDFAITIYHTFVALCYLTPILGAIIADSWLGKFKTIIYLSIVYAVGQVVMAVSAIHDITDTNKDGVPDSMTFHVALSMVGLILIALGTGGIKPCVAAFGGDQFDEDQEKQRGTFFSIFYLSINAGSLLSTIITPILRAQKCGIHSKQQCYPLAFGVPAALMVVALIVFIVGSGMYTKVPPAGNILVKVCKCVGFAVSNRFKHRSSTFPKRAHWMDWAEEKYDKLLIAQVKMVLKVLFLYLPLPMFWTLFDQKNIPATTMNGDFVRFLHSLSSHQTVNPILILVLVPIMDSIVYPLISKCKLNFTPLRRMTVGMFFAAVAFVAAALVQLQIDNTLPKFSSSTESQAKFINMVDGTLHITCNGLINAFNPQATQDYLTFDEPFEMSVNASRPESITLPHGNRTTLVIAREGFQLGYRIFQDFNTKPDQGYNTSLFLTGSCFGRISFTIENLLGNQCSFSRKLGFGSSFTYFIPSTFAMGENCDQHIREVEDIKPNSIHMAWQIPQYFLMTTGEVVFSVTGLEFSYSQAPSNMKSVLQAGWLLTVAVGNIIVLIVAEAAQLPDKWAEYILFASLLVLVCIIFAVMAMFYTYTDPAKIEAQFLNMEPEDKEKKNMEKDKKGMADESGKSSDFSSDEEKTKQSKL
uniref:Solute carrier family 15 member 1 n=1 Tax=Nothobranchius furzeri TaxID=105023 RepID=A0A8C6KVZ9_NOTFU